MYRVEKLEHLRDKMMTELEKVADTSHFDMDELCLTDRLTHAIKNLDRILVVESDAESKEK